MKTIIILFFVGIVLCNAFSQEAKIEIRGTVNDINTNTPLVNVNIQLKAKNLGAITNELGQFYIISNRLPVTLVFTHVGYEYLEHTLSFEPLQPITIQMQPKTELLKGVVITSEKIDTVYQNRHYSVLDYELKPEGIVLLIYRYTLNRSEILFKDYQDNEMASIKTIPGKPIRLYKDCLGDIHIFTRKKSYQIYFEKQKLTLYPAIDIDSFMDIMQYCQVLNNGKLYYQEKGYLDLINIYYSIDSIDKKLNGFYTIVDQDKLDFLMSNPENLSLINSTFTPSLSDLRGLSSDALELNQIRNMEVELRFNQMAYFPALFAPMFKLGDSLVIFNHPNSSIDFFNKNDSIVGSTSISYHNRDKEDKVQNTMANIFRADKWQKEIFIDQSTQKAYTSFINLNGTKTITEIDLQTGQLTRSIKIPFPYIEKIQFHNGYMYYMYKGWGESQKKKLFRQKVE